MPLDYIVLALADHTDHGHWLVWANSARVLRMVRCASPHARQVLLTLTAYLWTVLWPTPGLPVLRQLRMYRLAFLFIELEYNQSISFLWLTLVKNFVVRPLSSQHALPLDVVS